MPRESEPSVNERDFVLSALREKIRLDGRSLGQFRPVELVFGDDYGVADVRMGKTRVMVKLSTEVVVPYADRKFEGLFTISTELSPMASPAFEVGRQDQTEIILSRLLEKTIRRSGALDTESLCIVAGQKCFHLRADVHVLNHDGNLVDASCVALIAALLHFRRPEIEINGEDVTIFSHREREPVKLSIQHQPFCITASYFEGGTIILHDATLLEEHCREGEVVISMNRFGEICQVATYADGTVDGANMLACADAALEKVKVFDKLVKAKLEEDEKSRDAGGLMAELRAENER